MIHEELIEKIDEHSERLENLKYMLDEESNLDVCGMIIGRMVQEAKEINRLEEINKQIYLSETF